MEAIYFHAFFGVQFDMVRAIPGGDRHDLSKVFQLRFGEELVDISS